MRGVSTIGSGLESTRAELKVNLEREDKLRALKHSLDHVFPTEGVRFVMLQMIPCVMCMGTRVGLKLLALILQDSLTNSKGQ